VAASAGKVQDIIEEFHLEAVGLTAKGKSNFGKIKDHKKPDEIKQINDFYKEKTNLDSVISISEGAIKPNETQFKSSLSKFYRDFFQAETLIDKRGAQAFTLWYKYDSRTESSHDGAQKADVLYKCIHIIGITDENNQKFLNLA